MTTLREALQQEDVNLEDEVLIGEDLVNTRITHNQQMNELMTLRQKLEGADGNWAEAQANNRKLTNYVRELEHFAQAAAHRFSEILLHDRVDKTAIYNWMEGAKTADWMPDELTWRKPKHGTIAAGNDPKDKSAAGDAAAVRFMADALMPTTEEIYNKLADRMRVIEEQVQILRETTCTTREFVRYRETQAKLEQDFTAFKNEQAAVINSWTASLNSKIVDAHTAIARLRGEVA